MSHDAQDCLNHGAQLPLRALLPLYAFVALLCAEAFRCGADLHPLLEDIEVAAAAPARLDPPLPGADAGAGAQPTLVLLPSALPGFVDAAAEAAAAAAGEGGGGSGQGGGSGSAARKGGGGRGDGGSGGDSAPSTCPAALLADYAAGVTEAQRALQRLQAGSSLGVPCALGAAAGVVGLAAGSAASGSGVGASCASASPADLAERSRLCQALHRLLYAEAVLAQLFQRCEDVSDGLEATSQVLRFMAKGLDEVRGCGGWAGCGWLLLWLDRGRPRWVGSSAAYARATPLTRRPLMLPPSAPPARHPTHPRSSLLARWRSRCPPPRRCTWSSSCGTRRRAQRGRFWCRPRERAVRLLSTRPGLRRARTGRRRAPEPTLLMGLAGNCARVSSSRQPRAVKPPSLTAGCTLGSPPCRSTRWRPPTARSWH